MQDKVQVTESRQETCSEGEAHTYASPSTDVYSHSWRTLAEEGAGSVDALSIDANSRKHLTLIHIWQLENSIFYSCNTLQ